MDKIISDYFSKIGQKGGQKVGLAKSEKKAAAGRENLKKAREKRKELLEKSKEVI